MTEDRNDDIRTDYDTVVVGAGIAGLAAAHILRKANKKVLILEARARIGGRICTDRSFAGVPVELGAELIHGSDASTWPLVRDAGIATRPMDCTLIRKNGIWKTQEQANAAEATTPSLAALPLPLPHESMAHYLERNHYAEAQLPLNVRLLDIDNEPFRNIDAMRALNLSLDDDTEDYPDCDYQLRGGYDRLLSPFADGADIRYNARVDAIHRDAHGGSVHFTVDGIGHAVSASTIVITLPLGVLQHRDVQFVPDLPAARWACIDALGVVTATKMIFRFTEPVMPQGATALLDFEATPAQWWSTPAATSGDNPSGEEIIVGWAAGDRARFLMRMAGDAAQHHCLNLLRQVTGKPALIPTAFITCDWQADPYSRGAYSYTPLAATAADRSALAEPIGGVWYWAGEATDQAAYATVHGAYNSGVRAAQAILAQPEASPLP